jgi:hypothetical protein
MAIAEAVLHHLVTQTHSNNLFITHYPPVAISLSKQVCCSFPFFPFSLSPRPNKHPVLTLPPTMLLPFVACSSSKSAIGT